MFRIHLFIPQLHSFLHHFFQNTVRCQRKIQFRQRIDFFPLLLQLFLYTILHLIKIQSQRHKHINGPSVTQPQQSQKQMFRIDFGISQSLGFLSGTSHDLLQPFRITFPHVSPI